MSNAFTLRRLEMAMPIMDLAKTQDPQALVKLAALTLADEEALKLSKAGNESAMQVYMDKAYDMDSEEVAALLGVFMKASQRFSLRLAGLSSDQVNLHMKTQEMNLLAGMGIESQDESVKQSVATKKP